MVGGASTIPASDAFARRFGVRRGGVSYQRGSDADAWCGPYTLFLKASNGKVSIAVWVHVS